MPKSKRDKKVSLTKTDKKGKEAKNKMIEDIVENFSNYEHLFLFTVDNMRNTTLKTLRNEWKDSRFYFGKNKILSIALKRTKSSKADDELSLISDKLKGQCGLLMTNRDVTDVIKYFQDYQEGEYARAGFIPNRDVILPQGPLEDYSHNMEPHLRRLGLPTSLEKGVIHLIKEYQVCKEGVPLTPEKASILKLLGIQMAKFKVVIKCHWTKGKGFHVDLDMSNDDKIVGNSDLLEDNDMEDDET